MGTLHVRKPYFSPSSSSPYLFLSLSLSISLLFMHCHLRSPLRQPPRPTRAGLMGRGGPKTLELWPPTTQIPPLSSCKARASHGTVRFCRHFEQHLVFSWRVRGIMRILMSWVSRFTIWSPMGLLKNGRR